MGRSAKFHKRLSRKERDFKKITRNSLPDAPGGSSDAELGGSDLEPEVAPAKRLQAKQPASETKLHSVKSGKVLKALEKPKRSALPADIAGSDGEDEEGPAWYDEDGDEGWEDAESGEEMDTEEQKAALGPEEAKKKRKKKKRKTDWQKDANGVPEKRYILQGRKDYVEIFQKGPRKKSAAARVVNFYPSRIL